MSDQQIVDRLYAATLDGDASAARALGDLAAEGLLNQGKPDWSAAAGWYSLAIDGEQADADALFSLGHMNLLGRGVPEDSSRARTLFRAAADLNHPAALFWLGRLSAEGIGGERDADTALIAYQRALALELPGAEDALFDLFDDASSLVQLREVNRLTVGRRSERSTMVRAKNYLPHLPRTDIRRVQEALLAAGFDPQGADGLIGPNSRAAIAEFRTARGRAAESVLTLLDLSDLGLI